MRRDAPVRSVFAVAITTLALAGPATSRAQTALIGTPPAMIPGAGERMRAGGQLSLLFDTVPRQDATELRARLRLETSGELGPVFRYRLDATFDGVAASRDGR